MTKDPGEAMSEEIKQAEAETNAPYGEIIDALRGRNAFYDMFANVYFKPLTAEQVENFANTDFSAYEDINEQFADGVNDIRRYLAKRNSGTRQELAVDYTGAFGSTSSWKGRYAAPYESVHTSEEGLMYQGAYHEVFQLYKQHHVVRAEGYDYPHDHLSFMCEFQVILAERAIEAMEAGNPEEALKQIKASQGFLEDHILSWFDDLADLAVNLLHTRFYRGILKISKGFFLFDQQLLADIAEVLEEQVQEA